MASLGIETIMGLKMMTLLAGMDLLESEELDNSYNGIPYRAIEHPFFQKYPYTVNSHNPGKGS